MWHSTEIVQGLDVEGPTLAVNSKDNMIWQLAFERCLNQLCLERFSELRVLMLNGVALCGFPTAFPSTYLFFGWLFVIN